MEQKIKINSIILILLSIAVVILILVYTPLSNNECIEANILAEIIYDGCYDPNTESLFLTIEREDYYQINEIALSFIGLKERVFKITNLPRYNQSKTYQFNSSKNPGTVYISLDIPSIKNCEEPKIVILKECSSKKQNISSSISSTEKFDIIFGDQIRTFQDSGLLPESLVEKERIWATICESKWLCESWEECKDNIQRRRCLDENKCPIPTGSPQFTRNCGNICTENWICTWSNCIDGFTTPTCRDQNNCGTRFTELKKLACKTLGECIPNIKCTLWSKCGIDYNFDDLITTIETMDETKIRLCEDQNNCIDPTYEIGKCSISVDISARKTVVQNNIFIEIYNRLTNKIIATIRDRRDADSSLVDISF